ncbi:MAG: DUF72 domain-containing protein [Pirellula sp.]|nr:DUF72 domain-containing protein [Pirellula sp.]
MPDAEVDTPRAIQAFIGCAGWSLRKEHFPLFSGGSSHLERYASRFNCVEINSSFYRSHRVTTYQRWAETTPPGFRFSVKLPKQITHVNRLKRSHDVIAQFSVDVGGLGSKLGAVLVQLPPSFEFERSVADEFFAQLMDAIRTPIVVEPRHSSWFGEAAKSLLAARAVGRVAADPAVTVEASTPLIASDLAYYRWHGSPRIYFSSYCQSSLSELAHRVACLKTEGRDVWCIFDNTAGGAATINALSMQSYCDEALNVCEC